MADLIKIKGGSGDVPTLQDRELAYCKTEKALYIGTASGNVRLCDAEDATKIAELTAQYTELNGKIEELTSQNTELSSKIAELEAQNVELSSSVADLANGLSGVYTRLEKLENTN